MTLRIARNRKLQLAGVPALLVALAGAVPATASAGILDTLFGSDNAKAGDTRRRSWSIHEFTQVKLVAREAGAPANQHPLQVDREVMRQLLAQVRFVSGDGTQSLFANEELGDIAEPLSQAFASATPEDDVILLSSSRRSGGILSQPLAVTARLFARDGAIQLVVHDARYEFFNEMRGTNRAPTFTFGSRTKAGSAVLRSSVGSNSRADWLALPTSPGAAAAPAVAAPTTAPAPATRPAAAAAASVAAPAALPRGPNFADEVEQRLITLKRLRDKGLISEEEYQQKRREILAQL